ncbi:putative bifunctional diguanylate cyclase/phosphodiesterase [Dendrosporobacter sp. 1207_IL3150]|uniref:putative bifunctional diguanylate cyclase/phosphodiesterase n=1 Tax=Dendrosporobacter sp. 1207_IL3150 TaxID=3084054 RepID=UPI002FDB8ECC
MKSLSILLREVNKSYPHLREQLLTRNDSVGVLARVLVHDIKIALAKGEFTLVYQPQFDSTNRMIGVEALLRWSHKQYGSISPLLIIAIAEETGLIRDIGNWVISAACRQLRDWKRSGIDRIRMSVNVSAVQLQDKDFTNDLLATIKINGLRPSDLEIEITENIALNDDVRTRHNLDKMRETGIRIAIDDFGMGHTSLRYIKDYRVDTLKIDQILSKDVVDDKNCQEIINSIVSLCSSLEIDTIVEYVESQEQRDMLQELGCRQYQGYYYSPPLTAEQLMNYVNNSSEEQVEAVAAAINNS